MQNLGTWMTALTTLTSTVFALPLLGFAALFSAISFMTGNKDAGRSWAIWGLVGFGIMTGINVIVNSIPKVS